MTMVSGGPRSGAGRPFKLDEDQVRVIREMTADGKTHAEIAAVLKVHQSTVTRYLKLGYGPRNK